MKLVYIETTIPSAYFDTRPAPELVARRNWTRRWWDEQRHQYQLVTSIAVREECARGKSSQSRARLRLLEGIDLLAPVAAVADIVDAYVDRKLMPRDPSGDALHLALSSFYKCDILLTWNCSHLANYNKMTHLRLVNTVLGLHVPALITPLELLNEEPDYGT